MANRDDLAPKICAIPDEPTLRDMLVLAEPISEKYRLTVKEVTVDLSHIFVGMVQGLPDFTIYAQRIEDRIDERIVHGRFDERRREDYREDLIGAMVLAYLAQADLTAH